METIYNVDYLINFVKEVYQNNKTIEDFQNFLIKLSQEENFDNIENNFYIFVTFDYFKSEENLSYLVKKMINAIELSIISNSILKTNNKNIIQHTEPINLEKFFVEKYSPFKVGSYGIEELPKEGQVLNLRFKDNVSFPDKTYIMEFIIDQNGEILGYDMPPEEEMSTENLENFYTGLLNEILESN